MPRSNAPAMRTHDAPRMSGTQMLAVDATYERTDVRTNERITYDRNQSPGPYRARAYDDLEGLVGVSRIGELLGPVIHRLCEPRVRWPRRRSGERDPIGGVVRRLVYQRDGFACQFCGSSFDLQLDHVIPWSAYGPDTSDNLRTLCEFCNDKRSNYREPFERPQIPVTQYCFWCSSRCEWGEYCSDPDEIPDVHERLRAYCGTCGTTSWVPDRYWLL